MGNRNQLEYKIQEWLGAEASDDDALLVYAHMRATGLIVYNDNLGLHIPYIDNIDLLAVYAAAQAAAATASTTFTLYWTGADEEASLAMGNFATHADAMAGVTDAEVTLLDRCADDAQRQRIKDGSWSVSVTGANLWGPVTLNGKPVDFDAAVNLMDDEIRERLHSKFDEGQEQEFLDAYVAAHAAKYDGKKFSV